MGSPVVLVTVLLIVGFAVSFALNLVLPAETIDFSLWAMVAKDLFLLFIVSVLAWLILNMKDKRDELSLPGSAKAHPDSRELTAARQAQIDMLLRQMPEGVVIFENWRIVFANLAAARILGYQDESFILGRNVMDFVDSSSEQSVEDRVSGFLSGKGANEDFVERTLVREDGSRVVVEIAAKPIENVGGMALQIVMRDLTQVRTLNNQLLSLNKSLASLSSRTLGILEDERKALAYELHDEIGQVFASLAMQASLLMRMMDPEDTKAIEKASGMRKEAITASKRTRTLALKLMPPQLEELGLKAAIEWLIDQTVTPAEIECGLEFDLDEGRLTDRTSLAIFRIVQEAITNILKHAEASVISVMVKDLGKTLEICIADNGRGGIDGLSHGGQGIGLQGIRDRVELLDGTLKIDSSAGFGTRITANVQLKGDGDE